MSFPLAILSCLEMEIIIIIFIIFVFDGSNCTENCFTSSLNPFSVFDNDNSSKNLSVAT